MAKNDTKRIGEPNSKEAAENQPCESNRLDSRTNHQPLAILPRLGYSVNETASVLGIAPGTVYHLLQRGLLKSASGLRTKVIPLKEIERFLNN